MRNVFKMFLAPMLLLSTIGAVAQTVATNENARSAQENGQQTAATVAAVRVNEPANLFMNRLQNDGLLDHAFMKVTANFAPTHTVSTAAVSLCKPSCTGGLVCCDCTIGPRCETEAVCKFQCSE